MPAEQAKIISYPDQNQEKKRPAEDFPAPESERSDEEFLDFLAEQSGFEDRVASRMRACLNEIAVARQSNSWEKILTLFHPLEDKEPDLVKAGMDMQVRKEIAYAMGQLHQYDQALAEYEKCWKARPDDFLTASAIAYTLYNCVYATKNREMILPGKLKQQRLRDAHKWFAKAQELKPHRVTNFYRQAMLYKNIECKREKAVPLFSKAISNWEEYDDKTRKRRHQERKNYVKSLYNLASCHLQSGRTRKALECMESCLEKDEGRDYVRKEFKYFALGKIHFFTGEYGKAEKALEFAAGFVKPWDGDFVFELWARTLLAQKKPKEAMKKLTKIPEKMRRPYVRWTEADTLLALGDRGRAKEILKTATEKDSRSRHKTLVRLARIYFAAEEYEHTIQMASEADDFHRHVYTTPDPDGLFWKAAALARLDRLDEAREVCLELEGYKPGYSHLPRLKSFLAKKEE